MRPRSPWWPYVGLILSGGVFGFVWVFLMMRDVNRLERRPVVPLKRLATALGIGLLLYSVLLVAPEAMVAIFSSGRTTPIVAAIVLATTLVVLLIIMLTIVDRYAQVGLGRRYGAIDALAIIGLVFANGVAFIAVQQRLNSLIEKRSQAS